MQGLPILPTIDEFLQVVNELLGDVNAGNWTPLADDAGRTSLFNASHGPKGRGVRAPRNYNLGTTHKIINAIHTIADFQNEHWEIRVGFADFQLPFVDIGDRPHDAPLWATIQPPFATVAAFNAYTAALPQNDPVVVRERLAPTTNEVRQAMVIREVNMLPGTSVRWSH